MCNVRTNVPDSRIDGLAKNFALEPIIHAHAAARVEQERGEQARMVQAVIELEMKATEACRQQAVKMAVRAEADAQAQRVARDQTAREKAAKASAKALAEEVGRAARVQVTRETAAKAAADAEAQRVDQHRRISPAPSSQQPCGSCANLLIKSGARMCGQCKEMWYCDRECQKAAWKAHKAQCAATSAAAAPLSTWAPLVDIILKGQLVAHASGPVGVVCTLALAVAADGRIRETFRDGQANQHERFHDTIDTVLLSACALFALCSIRVKEGSILVDLLKGSGERILRDAGDFAPVEQRIRAEWDARVTA
jgi:hypothetical protein